MRTTRIFAFIDVSGFTAYTDTHGDGAAIRLVTRFRTIVRDVAGQRAVRIAKWLGDGAMLVGLDTTAMLSAVLEIDRRMTVEELPLPLRCGLTRGDVVLLEGDDYIGRAVNLAARLCEEAESHSTLMPAPLSRCAPTWATVEAAGDRVVRDFQDPLELVTVRLPDDLSIIPPEPPTLEVEIA